MAALEIAKTIMDRFLVAVIILLIGIIVARLVNRFISNMLVELEVNTILKKTAKVKFNVAQVIARTFKYFIYFVTIIMVLNELGITTTVLQILAGAAALLIVLSLLLAFKDYIPSFFAGFVIHRDSKFKVGDKIKVDGMEGKIESMNMIECVIVTKRKDKIHIPNSTLAKSRVMKTSSRE